MSCGDLGRSGALESALESFARLGARLGLALHRLNLKPDGGGEAEFQAPNPVEILVLKWTDLEELDRFLETDPAELALVNRKKCTRCLQHERPWPPRTSDS